MKARFPFPLQPIVLDRMLLVLTHQSSLRTQATFSWPILYKIGFSTDRVCKNFGGACRKIMREEAGTALNNEYSQRIWDNRRINIDGN